MATLGSIEDNARRAAPEPAVRPHSMAARAELRQLEKQLSEWVHCASAKTQMGMEKIAEIASKINAIKGAMQQEAAQGSQGTDAVSAERAGTARPPLRLDGTGAWVSVQA